MAAPTDLFVSPEEQIENVRRWDKDYRWGLTPGQITRAGLLIRRLTAHADPFTVPVLVPRLMVYPSNATFHHGVRITDINYTFNRLCEVIGDQHWLSVRPEGWLAHSEHHSIVRGQGHTPSLNWQTINLAATPSSPAVVPPGKRASVGLLAAAAHFPAWLESVVQPDAGSPAVCLWGYRARAYSVGDWGTLALSGEDGIPVLSLVDNPHEDPTLAHPVIL